jgi:transposase
MSTKTRRHYSPEQKADLLRKHHLGKVPISDLCDQNRLQPSVLYHWQRQLFDKAPLAFVDSKGPSRREQELEQKVALLEAKLAKKDAVIAEISEEYVQLKKTHGAP